MRRSLCRFCGSPLEQVFADLGVSPLANSYVTPERRLEMEPFFPLRAYVCSQCFLVQLEEHGGTPDSIFSDYAYFSSYSTSWLEHSRAYARSALARFGLGAESKVVELASNDGYLLQYFVEAGIPVLGVEPAANVAEVAVASGVPTAIRFFGRASALELRGPHSADLLIGNNVLAHVPDLNDFVAGLKLLLKPRGVITMEFPHLMRLIEDVQFDTIYHEHFSYFSFSTAQRVFAGHGLELFDVEELPTHGGSLRIYARHEEDHSRPVAESVRELGRREADAGYNELAPYAAFAERVKREKWEMLSFLIEQKRSGSSIAGYGAPAKGNTLLNYCGIGTDIVDYTVDRNPRKQGTYLPGSRIPILDPSEIERTRPDLLFILPWNLRDEVIEQMAVIRDWGGRFVVRSPRLRVFA
ncbi:MAG: methyltransferase domain-containing protein [Gaiellaceae bacterium]